MGEIIFFQVDIIGQLILLWYIDKQSMTVILTLKILELKDYY